MLRLTEAHYLDGLRLRVAFSDGTCGIVDLQGRLNGPIFRSLNDPEVFRQFELTDHTVAWSNGADFAPEYLHALACGTDSSLATREEES